MMVCACSGVAQQTKFMTSSGKECRVCGAKYAARRMTPHMKKHVAEAFGDQLCPNRAACRLNLGHAAA